MLPPQNQPTPSPHPTDSPPTWVVGNWKMNGDIASSLAFLEDLANYDPTTLPPSLRGILCPPAPLLSFMAARLQAPPFNDAGRPYPLFLGAQDCSSHPKGAHTGEIAAYLLREVGAGYVLLGHSESRSRYHHDDATMAHKILQAQEAGLLPIVCIGEPLDVYEGGWAATSAHLRNQLDHLRLASTPLPVGKTEARTASPDPWAPSLMIAYEPCWAIGTGLVPNHDYISACHAFIADILHHHKPSLGKVPVMYGGSVTPDNAGQILALPHVDGVLVGGASLQASSFWRILTSKNMRKSQE